MRTLSEKPEVTEAVLALTRLVRNLTEAGEPAAQGFEWLVNEVARRGDVIRKLGDQLDRSTQARDEAAMKARDNADRARELIEQAADAMSCGAPSPGNGTYDPEGWAALMSDLTAAAREFGDFTTPPATEPPGV